MKQRIPNSIYSKEFRGQVVNKIAEEELSAEAGVKQLSMPKSTLARWVTAS